MITFKKVFTRGILSTTLLLGFNQTLMAHGAKTDESQEHAPHADISKLLTGQGDFVFAWDQTLTEAFPEAAKLFEPKMHGGFNEDPDTGIVYTGIPGYGLCSISSDLKTWTKLGDDPKLEGNVHGLAFFIHKGKKYIALAQQGDQRILIVELNGNIVQEIKIPKGTEFNFKPANDFYSGEKPNFAVTDVTYLDGKLYAVTGYSKGDFVLVAEEKDGLWVWSNLAWGGKGNEPGQFQTAHGITAYEGFLYVGNRAAQQVVKFDKQGNFIRIFDEIPKGSLICNVATLRNYFFLCPLNKVGPQSSAPIYVHTGDKLLSTIIPGDLKIPVLSNIHHAWPHEVTGADGSKQLYILVHGWNKGKYAVLKHVR